MTEDVIRDGMKPRGIANQSQVSCHLTCALQMLIHATPLLRDVLIEFWRCNENGSGYLIEMGNFFANAIKEDQEALDPSVIYASIEEIISINSNELGDAVLALRRIVKAIRRDFAEMDLISDLMKDLFDGMLVQEIVGIKDNVQRIKSSARRLNFPFALAGNFSSLEEALRHATINPIHPIKGYKWGETENYTESEVYTKESLHCSDESAIVNGWTTFKRLRLQRVPQYLFLHLQRFSMVDGCMKQTNEIMDVPLHLDISPYCDILSADKSSIYYLCGAILHVLDLKEKEGEENGHYISIAHVGDSWYFIDDEKVVSLENKEENMLEVLSGRTFNFAHLENYRFTTVLATYCCHDKEYLDEEVFDNLRHEFFRKNTQDNVEKPMTLWDETLVGRRLRVRWSKGKFYSGIISKYDETTGKHTIEYDDGDIREYKLSKKTIEWE